MLASSLKIIKESTCYELLFLKYMNIYIYIYKK